MHYFKLPLCGLLWLCLPLCHGRPIRADGLIKLKSDAIMISKTLITRIQQHPIQFFFPSNLKISGLDFIPDKQLPESLGQMDETLEIFQKIMSSIPLQDVDQMLSDIENLRSLLKVISEGMGCVTRKSNQSGSLVNLTEEHAKAPYTTEKATLDRLQTSLETIVKNLNHVKCS
ncbi:leptin [Discoglossus pictus]